MEVGHLADHSGSPQHADTKKQTSTICFDSGTCRWAVMNTELVSNCEIHFLFPFAINFRKSEPAAVPFSTILFIVR